MTDAANGRPVVLGLDFGGTKIAVAVADADGRLLRKAVLATDPSRGAGWNLERALDSAHTLLRDEDGAILTGVGAATFGVPEDARILLAPAIPGWEALALARELRAAFDCAAVTVDTDVKAAALAELRLGALAGCRHAVYLNLGTGLAAALVVDGAVVLGENGAAGEIGYSLVEPSDVLRERHLVLEDVAGGIGVAAAAERATGRRMAASGVFELEGSEPLLAAVVEQFIEQLAFHLVNLSVALNPSRIAVGGGIVRAWPRIEPTLRRALAIGVPFPPELVVAAFPFDAPLVGAVLRAVDATAGGGGR